MTVSQIFFVNGHEYYSTTIIMVNKDFHIIQDSPSAQNATVHSYNMAFPTTSSGLCIDIIIIIVRLNCLHVLVLSILLTVLHCFVFFIYSAIVACMLINHLLFLLLLLYRFYL